MKIIHCADLHLDSRCTAHLDPEGGKERRRELLHTYERMISYAEENGVSAILIGGDLFDGRIISAGTKNLILHSITSHPEITFFYLKGNHDIEQGLMEGDSIPENLKLFSSQWRTYPLGRGEITVTGKEIVENQTERGEGLSLPPEGFHIVMLHGQIGEYGGISLRDLRGKGIDYLALGHVHSRQEGKLDQRGIYVYPGCLEGRGFDECGEHGFYLLEINEKTWTASHRFVPFASRSLYKILVDVTDLSTTPEILEKIRRVLKEDGCSPRSLLKIILTGEMEVTGERDLDYLTMVLEETYYFVTVEDETRLKADWEAWQEEESLRGEFLRLVLAEDSLTHEEQMKILTCGLQVLAGEEMKEE